jgi:HD-GYP domain-containing protein (c-di-GMP phosphodiesterase class II)
LLDIGKAGVPEDLLNSAESLSPDDLPRVRAHVQVSLKIMDEAGIHNPVVRDMVLTHHERIDGSGYPDGLTLTNIPLFGRIAAVIDSYDAMTSERPYRPAVSRHEALQQLYRAHETLYQSEVVEQFLQCLGVYPTGSLVELSNGKVGIVMEQNQARRLQPRLLLLLDANKERYARFPEIDLLQHAQAHPDQPIRIVSALEPNAYGLDPRALYLV